MEENDTKYVLIAPNGRAYELIMTDTILNGRIAFSLNDRSWQEIIREFNKTQE